MTAPTGASTALLLVEDNVDQQTLVQRAFRRYDPTITVTVVGDGETCLSAVRQQAFSVILLDHSLPRMTGLQILAKLSEQGCRPPVIMVTGQGDETIAVEAMKAGAYDYVVKSKNYLTALPTVVDKVLARHRMQQQLKISQRRLQRLQEWSVAVTRELKLSSLAQVFIDGACELTDSECGIAIFARQGREDVELWATHQLQIKGDGLNARLADQGLWSLALQSHGVVRLDDIDMGQYGTSTPAHHPEVVSGLTLALRREEEVVGILFVGNPSGRRMYEEEDGRLLATLASHVVTATENVRFVEEAQRQASTDHLTGLFNHREFQRRLEEELIRSQRYGHECSLLMLDIDHFKGFNDTYGHPVGDDVLRTIGRLVTEQIRQQIDLPARYGGEEFAVILPETDAKGGFAVAERIRARIFQVGFEVQGGVKTMLSVSIGVATFPHDATIRPGLIQTADQALYFAKQAGRNTVFAYRESLKARIEKDHRQVTDLLLTKDLKVVYDLAMAIDAKSPYLRGHSEAVAKLATAFAEKLSIESSVKESLMIAALLHNIGTIAIPDRILNKLGPLNEEERKTIQSHPEFAETLLSKVPYLENVIPAVVYHHERYDGSGYPDGLQGEQIPYLARVLAVVSAYWAMMSVRPYRRRLTQEEAVAELRRNAGPQFDPQIVDQFIDFVATVPL